jgi:hypothetical protein
LLWPIKKFSTRKVVKYTPGLLFIIEKGGGGQIVRFYKRGTKDRFFKVLVSHQWCDLFSSTTAQLYATHRKRE